MESKAVFFFRGSRGEEHVLVPPLPFNGAVKITAGMFFFWNLY